MPKYYQYPFGISGDRTAVADEPLTTEVSYQLGYTPEYALPKADPDRRNIDREPFNEILFDATQNIKQWQDYGYPEFVTDDGTGSPLSYQQGRIVYYLGSFYQAKVSGTATLPTDTGEWNNLGTYPSVVTDAIYTAADVLAKVITVDGSGSGLDADLFRGEAPSAFSKFGVGQSWQNVTGSRSSGVIYTNSTSNSIEVFVSCDSGSKDGQAFQVRINSFSPWVGVGRESGTAGSSVNFTVPAGHQYRGNGVSIDYWSELR